MIVVALIVAIVGALILVRRQVERRAPDEVTGGGDTAEGA